MNIRSLIGKLVSIVASIGSRVARFIRRRESTRKVADEGVIQIVQGKQPSGRIEEIQKPEPHQLLEDTEAISKPHATEHKPTITEKLDERVKPRASEKIKKAFLGIKRGPPPENRGPHRGPKEVYKSIPGEPYYRKFEIFCWKREREWILGIELPEEIGESSEVKITQNTHELTSDNTRDNCWQLEKVGGQVEVRWTEDNTLHIVKKAFGTSNYLLFKLSSKNTSQGYLVHYISSGWYLVIAPSEWVWDKAMYGEPPVSPEPVSIDGYYAHYVYIDKDRSQKIAFLDNEGQRKEIKSNKTSFELVGKMLNDADDEYGPLFAEKPPEIAARGGQGWNDIKTIVLGEEGRGRRKWRTHFLIDPQKPLQKMPEELLAKKGGWYFVRIYDGNDDLVESLDFRFLRSLKDIKISAHTPIPVQGTYTPVTVYFDHDSESAIHPDDYFSRAVQAKCDSNGTFITIPPDPSYDKTNWEIEYEHEHKMAVSVLVERIWWCIGEEKLIPTRWRTEIGTLYLQDFAATSKKSLWIRLPMERWTESVGAGFNKYKAKLFDVRVTEQTLAIPLRSFGDTEELNTGGILQFKVWITHNSDTYEVTVGQMSIKLACRYCDFVSYNEDEVISHCLEKHIDEFIRPLTYDEIRTKYPNLPKRIYRCYYCDYFITVKNHHL